MIITKIEPYHKKDTYKIEIDYDYAFWLYKSEIKKYSLEEGGEISNTLYYEIMFPLVLSRAKQKALNLLKYMDRTEKELCEKLKMAGYSQLIINQVITYIYQYHYLDDQRYARQYISDKKGKKSIKQIKIELKKKGISDDTLQEMLQDQDDIEAIEKAISKKMKNKDSISTEEKYKIAAYLYRKGFRMDEIWKYLNLIKQSE